MDTVVTPVKEFSKNSIRLVKRCTKPDRKGSFVSLMLHDALIPNTAAADANLGLPNKANDCHRLCRVQQDLLENGVGVRGHGLHRLLCQAHIHRELPSHWLTA